MFEESQISKMSEIWDGPPLKVEHKIYLFRSLETLFHYFPGARERKSVTIFVSYLVLAK